MAIEYTFYLSEEYADRLSAVKEEQGQQDLTDSEFARHLLEVELYRLHPEKVEEGRK